MTLLPGSLVHLLNWDSISRRLISLGERPLTARDRGLTAALLAQLADEVPPPFAVRRFLPLPTFSHGPGDLHTGAPGERDFGSHVDQTNYSVVVGERVVVKWLTPPVPLPHPTPDIFAHLVDSGFNDTAPPYAALTGVLDGREHLLALVTGYLPEARDGWEWCVDEAVAGSVSFATELGRLAADLHLALSTLPPTAPAGPAAVTVAGGEGEGERNDALRGDRSGAGAARGRTAEPGATRTATRAYEALAEALELTGEIGRAHV